MENNQEESYGVVKSHWRNWVSTGDFLQLLVIVVLIVASYIKQGAATEENRVMLTGQATLIAQLHEAVDQLRSQRNMTPEAAQRVGILESRVTTLEREVADSSAWRLRIEDKIDDIRKELSRK